MALPMIETGYKPEGALGALYQGFNAANADQSAELELVKQFLANQREQQLQPLDVNIKQTDSDYATMKRGPLYMDAAQRGYIGQMNTQDAAGTTAMALQPFKQRIEQAQLENEYGKQQNLSRIQEIDDVLNDPNVRFEGTTREQLLRNRQNLINRFKETPEFAQKRELKETGTDSAEYIAELRARQAAEAARLRGAGGDKPPKTAEEAAVRRLNSRFANGELTNDEYMLEIANIFNAKNAAKIQPGTTLAPEALPPGTPLKEKPPQQQYAPSTGTQPQPQPAKMTFDQISKMYPGVPADKLRKAYKDKFGVDLQ